MKAGITINGLAIINDHPVSWTYAHVQPPGGLPNYYRENVTGGPGSFVLEVHDFHTFGEAMTRKLVTEIAERGVPRDLAAAPLIARCRPRGRSMAAVGEDGEPTMGMLIDGVWHEQEPEAAKAEPAGQSGRFERARDRVPQLGDAGRAARAHRQRRLLGRARGAIISTCRWPAPGRIAR